MSFPLLLPMLWFPMGGLGTPCSHSPMVLYPSPLPPCSAFGQGDTKTRFQVPSFGHTLALLDVPSNEGQEQAASTLLTLT